MRFLSLFSLFVAWISPAWAGPSVAFVGLDYSHVRMIGTGDFNDPDAIFPGYLNAWNGLWVEEMMGPLAESLGAEVTLDNEGIFEANARAKADQIERRDGGESLVQESHITPEMIAKAVKGYAMKSTDGHGLVFIVDRLVKLQEKGCTYVVFFDVASRGVLKSTRFCEDAKGFGFRNYWFRTQKDLLKRMKKARP